MGIEPLKVVGHGLPLKDAADKAAGTGIYTVDMTFPGMLHAKILRSPHAHARILKVDASKALALPGVRAVITPDDVPRNKFTTAGHPPPDPTPDDQFILDHKVRYVGDKIAAVAADTNDLAREAIDLIEVEYEILPACFDPVDSVAEDAVDIQEDLEHGKNTVAVIRMEDGDVEKGFAEADFVIETRCEVPGQAHSMLEPVVAICHYEATGKLNVWSSTQIPFTLRRLMHDALGVPVRKIRVFKPIVGGGFGCKQDMQEEPLCALLSKAAGHRPVKLEYTREETFSATRHRHPYVMTSKTGVTKDGVITARSLYAVANTGAFSSHGPIVTAYLGAMWVALYRSPNFLFDGRTVYTNLPIAGAFRGYGVPQGTYASELHMDHLAREIGMDPLDLRRKNHIRSGDVHPATQWTIESCELRKCIDAGAEAIGWKEKRSANGGRNGKLRGVGAAVFTIASGAAPFALEASSATARVLEDGGLQLSMGVADTGQGIETTTAQVAAEAFGVSLDDVETNRVIDTDLSPYDNGAYATRQAYVGGMAAKLAAADARRQVLEHAAKMLEASVDDLDIVDGEVTVKSTPGKTLSVGAVAFDAQYGDAPHEIVGRADYTPPTNAPPFGAQFAEVEVDPETGEVELVRFVAAHDVGRALNPLVVEGQVEGGVAQGIGYGMMEELVFEAGTGRMLTADFAQYEIPTSMDTPEIAALLVEEGEPTGPYGAKGVGEPGIVPTAPAIANAVFDAIGVQIRKLPVTAERVLDALRGKNA
jgi:xanthine dehydrogenase molybdenum-binding subunit